MSRSSSLRRARPLLGTIVEIRADGDYGLAVALDAAFAEIAVCQDHLSAHQPGSDVRRLAATPPGATLAVDERTWEVLSLAREFAAASDGIFDPTVAPRLAAAAYLPTELADGEGDWRDLELLPDNHLRPRRPLAVDLGGIAKGYAVDRAVDILLAHGVAGGCVNAGGDLRLFGPEAETIYLRHPVDPTRLLPVGELADGACATSAPYFSRRESGGRTVCPVADPRDGSLLSDFDSITVIAERCVHADALTKIALLLGDAAEPLLALYGAQALRLDRSGRIIALPAGEFASFSNPSSASCRSSSQIATSD